MSDLTHGKAVLRGLPLARTTDRCVRSDSNWARPRTTYWHSDPLCSRVCCSGARTGSACHSVRVTSSDGCIDGWRGGHVGRLLRRGLLLFLGLILHEDDASRMNSPVVGDRGLLVELYVPLSERQGEEASIRCR